MVLQVQNLFTEMPQQLNKIKVIRLFKRKKTFQMTPRQHFLKCDLRIPGNPPRLCQGSENQNYLLNIEAICKHLKQLFSVFLLKIGFA